MKLRKNPFALHRPVFTMKSYQLCLKYTYFLQHIFIVDATWNIIMQHPIHKTYSLFSKIFISTNPSFIYLYRIKCFYVCTHRFCHSHITLKESISRRYFFRFTDPFIQPNIDPRKNWWQREPIEKHVQYVMVFPGDHSNVVIGLRVCLNCKCKLRSRYNRLLLRGEASR